MSNISDGRVAHERKYLSRQIPNNIFPFQSFVKCVKTSLASNSSMCRVQRTRAILRTGGKASAAGGRRCGQCKTLRRGQDTAGPDWPQLPRCSHKFYLRPRVQQAGVRPGQTVPSYAGPRRPHLDSCGAGVLCQAGPRTAARHIKPGYQTLVTLTAGNQGGSRLIRPPARHYHSFHSAHAMMRDVLWN